MCGSPPRDVRSPPRGGRARTETRRRSRSRRRACARGHRRSAPSPAAGATPQSSRCKREKGKGKGGGGGGGGRGGGGGVGKGGRGWRTRRADARSGHARVRGQSARRDLMFALAADRRRRGRAPCNTCLVRWRRAEPAARARRAPSGDAARIVDGRVRARLHAGHAHSCSGHSARARTRVGGGAGAPRAATRRGLGRARGVELKGAGSVRRAEVGDGMAGLARQVGHQVEECRVLLGRAPHPRRRGRVWV